MSKLRKLCVIHTEHFAFETENRGTNKTTRAATKSHS